MKILFLRQKFYNKNGKAKTFKLHAIKSHANHTLRTFKICVKNKYTLYVYIQ